MLPVLPFHDVFFQAVPLLSQLLLVVVYLLDPTNIFEMLKLSSLDLDKNITLDL
jgi:hypothetical protein